MDQDSYEPITFNAMSHVHLLVFACLTVLPGCSHQAPIATKTMPTKPPVLAFGKTQSRAISSKSTTTPTKPKTPALWTYLQSEFEFSIIAHHRIKQARQWYLNDPHYMRVVSKR